jgi:dihydroorotate dehydrogenase
MGGSCHRIDSCQIRDPFNPSTGILSTMDLYPIVRPLLFALPPEAAHSLTLTSLRIAHRAGLLAAIHRVPNSDPVSLMGLRFPNRLGVAAGLDKNGIAIDALGALGFGFIEVGTVTPRSQAGNAKPRLFRLARERALINRMGFPNDGVGAVLARLRMRRFSGICGVNIGKNSTTPLEYASEDYVACLRAVYSSADYVAINISSPNTAELRRLQHGYHLQQLLSALVDERGKREKSGRLVPILVKLTCDLSESELIDAARIAVQCGIDGIIASNTTVAREGVGGGGKEEGGLSGEPLRTRAMRSVSCIRSAVGPSYPVVGVGGIGSAEDALAMRSAGADLVQVYTGLIYRGPRLAADILKVVSSV